MHLWMFSLEKSAYLVSEEADFSVMLSEPSPGESRYQNLGKKFGFVLASSSAKLHLEAKRKTGGKDHKSQRLTIHVEPDERYGAED